MKNIIAIHLDKFLRLPSNGEFFTDDAISIGVTVSQPDKFCIGQKPEPDD